MGFWLQQEVSGGASAEIQKSWEGFGLKGAT